METKVIETAELTRDFGKVKAVNNVNITINSGDIYALIGPNGAGKTTLIKMLVGLLTPTNGQALICGVDINKKPVEAKANFGYVPDSPDVYGFLTGREFLQMTGNLRGMEKSKIEKRIKELENLFPLKEILGQWMSSYSRGNRQKTAFLAALLSEPKLLVIDEPIAGLDPTSMETFGQTLKKFAAEGGAVLLATHILSFGQKYASRVGVMSKGQIKKEMVIGEKTLETIYEQETK